MELKEPFKVSIHHVLHPRQYKTNKQQKVCMQNHASLPKNKKTHFSRPISTSAGNRNLLNFKAQLEIIRGRFALFDSEEGGMEGRRNWKQIARLAHNFLIKFSFAIDAPL